MIDRTTFDLRIAEHGTATARVERHEWKRPVATPRHAVRARLAQAMVTLAARLDRAAIVIERPAQARV